MFGAQLAYKQCGFGGWPQFLQLRPLYATITCYLLSFPLAVLASHFNSQATSLVHVLVSLTPGRCALLQAV